jgi:hypothetical protein
MEAQDSCADCAAGRFSRVGHTTCAHCPRGKFAFSAGSGACSACEPGQHQPATVASNCVGCPSGRFQHLWGKYYCYGCPEGKYNDRLGQTVCPDCDYCTGSGNVASSCYPLQRNCRVSQWSRWGKCSVTCAEGTAARTRSVVVTPVCGGKGCPSLQTHAACMDRPCDCKKVVCKWEKHTCSDYRGRASRAGWEGISHSNKGSCYNNGKHVKICGHHHTGGLCTTTQSNSCDDNALVVQDPVAGGAWRAALPAAGTAARAELDARRQGPYHSTCEGEQQSLRVYHDRDERRFATTRTTADGTVVPVAAGSGAGIGRDHRGREGAERGSGSVTYDGGVDNIEGHHCRMMGRACNCRCHQMFRNAYSPGSLRHVTPAECPGGTHSTATATALQDRRWGSTVAEVCVDENPCPAGFHFNATAATAETRCTSASGAAAVGSRVAYNPHRCDNTDPDVNQPASVAGKHRFGVAEKWSCKHDRSRFDLNYRPLLPQAERSAAATKWPTRAPTGSPTLNPCDAGTHGCDAAHGFCLRQDDRGGFRCACEAEFDLGADGRSCAASVVPSAP